MNRIALPGGFRLGGVGVGATTGAIAFAATGVGVGDATSGEIASFGRGAVAGALGSAAIEVDELGGADACGRGAVVLIALAVALALALAALPLTRSVPVTPR